MRKAAALVRQDAVVGVFRRELRHADTKGPALFHAFEDEVHSIRILLLQTAERRQNIVFFTKTLLRPFHRDLMMAGKGLHPGLIIVGALAEHLFAHHRDSVHLTDKMNHLFWPRQPTQITMDDDAIEAVVYQNEQIAEQPDEQFHRMSL